MDFRLLLLSALACALTAFLLGRRSGPRRHKVQRLENENARRRRDFDALHARHALLLNEFESLRARLGALALVEPTLPVEKAVLPALGAVVSEEDYQPLSLAACPVRTDRRPLQAPLDYAPYDVCDESDDPHPRAA